MSSWRTVKVLVPGGSKNVPWLNRASAKATSRLVVMGAVSKGTSGVTRSTGPLVFVPPKMVYQSPVSVQSVTSTLTQLEDVTTNGPLVASRPAAESLVTFG